MTEDQYVEMEAEDFLELVYGDREAWVDLPAKVSSYWVPFHTEWPADGAISRRIDSSLRDREDLYYSVAQFSRRGRRIEDVLPSPWLWADLDEVHPVHGTEMGLLPTVAVESSPGRYQALWRLSRMVAPKVLERLNRGLTYALDADKGGWDLTQVLRIPGTRNFKYRDAPVVRVLWVNDLEYDPREVWKQVKGAVPAAELRGAVGVVMPRRPIGSRAKALLRTPVDHVVEGERSARLWELECLLIESGLSEDEVFDLVWPSAWNKWSGMASGRSRLHRDIQKAIKHVRRRKALGEETREKESRSVERETGTLDRGLVHEGAGVDDEEGRGADDHVRNQREANALPLIGYSSFMAMAMEEPKWLIENIWTAGSHGIIGGEPKTSKTTIALALALSVASGSDFLGRYSVGVQGPVLMVQEENAPWMMQDRMRKIAASYGLISREAAHVRHAGAGALGQVSVDLDFPAELPLKLLNNYGFDLGIDEHREMLLAEVEQTRPKLLILDPLYLILPANYNDASDLRPFLQWMLKLRYDFDCAVVIVHHFRKQNQGGPVVRPGQRVLGNTILHGWSDSALYLEARDENRDGWISVKMETEFRSMAPQKPIELSLAMGPPGSLAMDVEVGTWSVEHAIRELVEGQPGITVVALAEALGVDKRTVLARVRGGDLGMMVKEVGRGRGHSHQVYVAGGSGSGSKNGDGGHDAG